MAEAPQGLRVEVRLFAEAMERQLKENDHKGGWDEESITWLLSRVREETDELAGVLYKLRKTNPGSAQRAALAKDALHEAADVGNFAMMIADVIGALPRPAVCTGGGASWCPVHGRCTCDWMQGHRTTSVACPLHGDGSDHQKRPL